MKPKKGKLFVISAPSGSGKTTLCQKLIQELARAGKGRLVRSISVTTRRVRKNERHGRDYFFVSTAEFLKRRRRRQFLEWAKVLGNFYGTPRDFVQRQISLGKDVLLSIDVQGAHKIRRRAGRVVFIFIIPPSFQELAQRLRSRSTESQAEIACRLKLAKREIGRAKEYDYVVLNDRVKRALAELKRIIQLERSR